MNTLFYAPGTCSIAAHIVLEEIGAPYELVKVDIRNKTPEFLAINPRGKVPALKTPHGILTENVAILSYLADTNPQAELLPPPTRDAFARGEATSWLAFLSSTLHTAFGPIFARGSWLDDDAAKQALVDYAKRNVERWYADVDDRLKGKRFSLGDRFSVVDAYATVFYRWVVAMGLFDIERYPSYSAVAQRVLDRPAAQRAVAREGG
jgi:glutathione S-transferase